MKQASANSVRDSWLDSMKDVLSGLKRTKRYQASTYSSLKNTSPSSTPIWTPILNSDLILQRGIPLAVIALLVIIALSSISTLVTSAKKASKSAKSELTLLSHVLTNRLEKQTSLETALSSPTLAEVYLDEALLNQSILVGHSILLMDRNKKIVAQFPSNRERNDNYISDLIGLLNQQHDDKAFEKVQLLEHSNGTTSFLVYRPIEINNSDKIGGILIAQDAKQVFAEWRTKVIQDTCLLIGFSMALLIILYVYLSQIAQSNATDQLYLETNARFDTALARGHCGLWDWDLARGRIVWSSSMYQILGLEPSDGVLSYRELASLVHPSDLDLMELANSAFKQENGNIDHRFRMMHSSGAWVWMRIRAELVRHKTSNPHLIGIAIDISEQEALKEQSRNADIRLRDAIENISEAFVLWDPKKRLVMCNSKYQQLYDLPMHAVTSGALHKDVMKHSRKPRARHQVPTDNKLESGAKTYQAQIEGGRWLQISERRTLDGGFVSVGTDITQIKRNQKELEQSERLQMETIADLRATQQKLERQAQKLVEFADNLNEEKMRADAGNKAKSEFLANISHELRTPLNAIIGFSDIMRTRMFGPLGSEKYTEYADDIHHSGSFLLGVINDILDMSKIEAGRFLLNPEPVLLDELLDETIRIIKVQADDAQITVNHKIPKTLELEADRRAVKQILLNLLSNSVKFTENGGHIDVTAKKLKDSVNIVIKDNGIGIEAEALKRLAQPFEQVQDQFTKNHKGTGLGLAIARSLAMLHGGTLKISSKPGLGTTVAVRLPIECQVERTEPETKQTGQAA